MFDVITEMSGKHYIRRALVFKDGCEKHDKDSCAPPVPFFFLFLTANALALSRFCRRRRS